MTAPSVKVAMQPAESRFSFPPPYRPAYSLRGLTPPAFALPEADARARYQRSLGTAWPLAQYARPRAGPADGSRRGERVRTARRLRRSRVRLEYGLVSFVGQDFERAAAERDAPPAEYDVKELLLAFDAEPQPRRGFDCADNFSHGEPLS